MSFYKERPIKEMVDIFILIICIALITPSAEESVAGEILKIPYQYSSDTGVSIMAAETFVLCDCKPAPALAVKPKEIPIVLKMTEPFHFILPAPVKEEPIMPKEEDGSVKMARKEEKGVAQSSVDAASGDDLAPVIILFGFNEKRIIPDQEGEILKVADRMKRSGGEVKVFGHTCDLGEKDQNDRISRERAESVAVILKEHGVVVAEVVGRGSCCPRSTDRRLNRRVEIYATKNGGDHEK